jgi:hypothetical protein
MIKGWSIVGFPELNGVDGGCYVGMGYSRAWVAIMVAWWLLDTTKRLMSSPKCRSE